MYRRPGTRHELAHAIDRLLFVARELIRDASRPDCAPSSQAEPLDRERLEVIALASRVADGLSQIGEDDRPLRSFSTTLGIAHDTAKWIDAWIEEDVRLQGVARTLRLGPDGSLGAVSTEKRRRPPLSETEIAIAELVFGKGPLTSKCIAAALPPGLRVSEGQVRRVFSEKLKPHYGFENRRDGHGYRAPAERTWDPPGSVARRREAMCADVASM